MLAALAVPVRLKLVVDEIVRVHVAEQDDVTAAAAIAAVRTAPRLVFFAPETDATTPAITGCELHRAFINKHARNDAERVTFAKGRFCDGKF